MDKKRQRRNDRGSWILHFGTHPDVGDSEFKDAPAWDRMTQGGRRDDCQRLGLLSGRQRPDFIPKAYAKTLQTHWPGRHPGRARPPLRLTGRVDTLAGLTHWPGTSSPKAYAKTPQTHWPDRHTGRARPPSDSLAGSTHWPGDTLAGSTHRPG
jgi:hypothetical protein